MKRDSRRNYSPVGYQALILLCFCIAGFAQSPTGNQHEVNYGNSLLADGVNEENPASFPADTIIAILQKNPTALMQAKAALAESLREQGQASSEVQTSDLFSRIRSDAKVRTILTKELRDGGYIGGWDDFSNNFPQPQLRTRPAPNMQRMREVERPELRPQPELNQPDVMRWPSPYADVPSLDDLYAQIPSQQKPLRRFGQDVFARGASPQDYLPIDLPVGPDYVLGPGDSVNIDLWGSISQQLRRVIDPEGRIALPEAGTVVLAGQTLAAASKLIEATLGRQFRDVRADISLGRLRTVRVYVVGDVEHPGAYDISSLSTPLNALIAAGGPTARGSLRAIRHFRGKQLLRELDLYEFLLQGVRSAVERLEPGDTILVPPVGPQVAVQGSVRRPAIYELKNETNLGDALLLAGGPLVSANLQQINVQRIEAHEKRVMLSFNVRDGSDGKKFDKALTAFPIQDGDRITVSPILPYSEKTVYLEGHVMRPGKYPYSKGMTVTDLIRSYRDLLPEPANRADIIRLEQPDFHPDVIEFNLNDVLTGDDPVELEPFDTLRILGRYELDAPKVAIEGEVLRPGEYPLAEGMTVSELLKLAGGFKRGALRSSADLTSYIIQNGERVIIGHSKVPLDAALGDDPKADPPLKPGDVLTIRQLSGWNDIGASVMLNGEVRHPGTYGIETGERLSSLLKRAGGFREEAYPHGAVLERQQVRELDQKSQAALIRRIESAQPVLKGVALKDETQVTSSFIQQQQQILSRLRDEPITGRLVIKISRNITRWQNTSMDVELRAGDVLTIPKKPSFVFVNGAVNNATAITYIPGKDAGWYLARAGGATEYGNKKAIFVILADGSVVGRGGASRWWTGGVLSTVMQPGDSVVVPERIAAPSTVWKNLLDTAQVTSSLAIAARVATTF